MSSPNQATITVTQSATYRETYANNVQMRLSVWDVFILFGLVHPNSGEDVIIENQQGIYLSPQQAKLLWNLLGQNLAQYEQAFGQIALEPLGPRPVQ